MTELLLIVDLETTGLDLENSQVIELGAILYSVKDCCTLQQLSTLFSVNQNPAIGINKIKPLATKRISDVEDMIKIFETWVDKAEYLVAHNALFDKKWFGKTPLPEVDKPWLCTYHDFIWDKNHTKTSLVNTALNHGIGVNSAHRSLTDCQLIALILDRIGEANQFALSDAVNKAIERSKEELYLVQAIVSYKEKDLAKKIRFGWHENTGKWIKVLKESDYLHENESWPFKSAIISKATVDEVPDEYLEYYR